MNAIPLLSTKTTPPPPRASLVPRARLLEKLDLSLLPGNRLTLLSAPAGFGKTTLVANWQHSLAQRGIPLAWLTLDEGDDDLNRFLRYLIAAMRRVHPGLGEAALAALDLPHMPAGVENLVVPLINELAALEGQTVLVLDDYQTVTALAIHQAMAYLVEHQPESLRLVVTTRNDPLLPLARLRARGQVNEIRSADLRFNREEALAFVRQTARLTLTPGQIAQLEGRTEGWAAGLQMAAIALGVSAARSQDPADLESFLGAFSGTHQYVFDYLAQEVLNQQDPATIAFLEQTAILDRLTPAACDALTGRSDSLQVLKGLERANLFLLPVDEQGQWYRYHRLFADFLRAGVDETRRLALNQRASAWFEGNGYHEEAVTYALRARDMPRAARLIRAFAPDMFNSGEFSMVLAWFDALPPDVIRADPDLCLYLASASLLSNRIEVASGWVQAVDQDAGERLSGDSLGRLLGLKAYIAYASGVDIPAAIAWAEEALRLIDPDDFFRLIVLSLLGQIQRQVGSVTAAIRSYEEAIHTSQSRPGGEGHPTTTGLAILQGNLAISYAIHGQLRRAMAYCQDALRGCLDASGRVAPQALFLYMPWAEICFDRNELAESRRLIELGSENIRRMGTRMTMVGGANILAALNYLQGNRDAALAGLHATQEEAMRLGLPWIASHAAAVEAWLELISGNVDAAAAWARDHYRPSLMEGNPLYAVEQLTYIRLLLAQDQAAQAQGLLEALRVKAEQGGRFLQLAEIEILLALAYDAQGEADIALEAFTRAARRAAPEGALRMFLNDRTAGLAKRLLASLAKEKDDTLAAFLGRILSEAGEAPPLAPRLVRPSQPAELVEAITPRELEVLALMAEGLSSAQIARKLVLTLNTLKAHTHSIYGKLDAHSRIQAVNRARQLGLLPPTEN